MTTIHDNSPAVRDDHRPLDVARKLAKTFRATARDRDREGGTPKAERDAIRRSGLLTLLISKEYGGIGESWPTVYEAIAEIASADASLGHLFGYHFSNFAYVDRFASPEQKVRWYPQAVRERWFLGNASSENNAHVLDWRVTATPLPDGSYEINGTKTFCSGSADADRLLVYAVTSRDPNGDGKIVGALIPSDRAGVQVNGDWDSLGMRQTDSGSVTFSGVVVYPDELLGAPGQVTDAFASGSKPSLWTPITQLIFTHLYLGIARGALEEAAHYTRSHSRPFTLAGVEKATEDPYVLAIFGESAAQLQVAEAGAREVALRVQELWERNDITPEERGHLMVQVASAKIVATRLVTEMTSRLYEAMGARAAANRRFGFDRFWRDGRTHTLHDPVAYKIREVGDWILNHRFPIPSFYS